MQWAMELAAPQSGRRKWRQNLFSSIFCIFHKFPQFPHPLDLSQPVPVQECLLLIPVEDLIEYKGDFVHSVTSMFSFISGDFAHSATSMGAVDDFAPDPVLPLPYEEAISQGIGPQVLETFHLFCHCKRGMRHGEVVEDYFARQQKESELMASDPIFQGACNGGGKLTGRTFVCHARSW